MLHRIRSSRPGGSGTVRDGSGKTRAGVYQGSLLLSTPGQPHGLDLRPHKGVSLCTRTGSTLTALPKAAPAGGILAHWRGAFVPLQVMACAVGRSSVRAVTRTAGVRLSKYRASRLYFDCNRGKFVFLETNGHIPMTIGHSLLKAGSEIEQVDRSIL